MAIFNKENKYKWEFANIGGSSRVKISKGDDIAHLGELDPKMWTVLSCPVNGLEIDSKSLSYMDCDGDGKLRINDVIAVSKWITSALRNTDMILLGSESIDINLLNVDDPNGLKLYNSANQILKNLGKDGNVISLSDTADITAIFSQTKFNGDGVITEASADDDDEKAAIAAAVATMGGVADRSGALGVNACQIEDFYKNLSDYVAWTNAAVEAPFGDNTDKVISAYNALDAKVKDYFMRSELASFSPDSTSSLDIQTSRIESISAENLACKREEIASYPLARVTGKSEIDLSAPINPVWASDFNTIKTCALPADAKVLTPADWAAVGAKFSAYVAWKGAKAGASVESLGIDSINSILAKDKKSALLALVEKDLALKEDAENIEMVDKFLHIYRDFYRLLRNFVTLYDFYDKDKNTKAIFQAGTLIVDQRACDFCMKVADMGKHNASAAASGMYLLYCDCTNKFKPGVLHIVAAVTVGDIGDFMVGKNGIYYDNEGCEWDAVITKIVDNPISVSQAFWSPYKRMANTVENLINKSAAEKDAKIMAKATESINSAPAAAAQANAVGADGKPVATPPFDIAKFAGIFAALGMAVGMIGTALSSIFKGMFALEWWQLILAFAGIILVISGPAMVMAWMKLRRRNIAPLLNANGWAVNAASKISIPFGETLTSVPKYPKMNLKDPYAKTGMHVWKKCLITILVLGAAFVALWLTNKLEFAGLKSPLAKYNKELVIEQPAQAIEQPSEAKEQTAQAIEQPANDATAETASVDIISTPVN